MKNLILITTLLSFAAFESLANNTSEPPFVQVKSRTMHVDKVMVNKVMNQNQIIAPTRHQTVMTKNADGSFSYQCKQKHNHNLDLDKVVK